MAGGGVCVLWLADAKIGRSKRLLVLSPESGAAGGKKGRPLGRGEQRGRRCGMNWTTILMIFTLLVLQIPGFASSSSAQGRYPRIDVSFLGIGEDKVGTGFQTHPNGDPDGHFRITLRTGGAAVQVTGIWIHTSDERGRVVSSTGPAQWWSTTGRGWILGVERNGKRLNQWDRKIDDVVSGDVEYDVFADGSAWFKRPGQHFTIGVELGNGSVLRSTIRVEGASPLR